MMLTVKTPDEVFSMFQNEFAPLSRPAESVPLDEAVGRVLAADVTAQEYVPGFDRSTVDGYAVRASDTFGCSDTLPAVLPLAAEVLMGEGADFSLPEGTCCYVPTGGAVPAGADCCIMLEYCEDYRDGTIGIGRPGAPGQNMIYRGDDVTPGKTVLRQGRRLSSADIGALAALGICSVPSVPRIRVGILSTGDELVDVDQTPGPGQVRDVNSHMIRALLSSYGAESVFYGIIADDETALSDTVGQALSECDAVLLSGGSSVGVKDASCRIIEKYGTLLLHGIAMKPGKPTILGKAGCKPIIGLPGHPVAAYFITRIFVLPLLDRLMGVTASPGATVRAKLSENVEANHGRAQITGVHLEMEDNQLTARPIRSKSGLITSLAGCDGFFSISRDCEGLGQGSEIDVTVMRGD